MMPYEYGAAFNEQWHSMDFLPRREWEWVLEDTDEEGESEPKKVLLPVTSWENTSLVEIAQSCSEAYGVDVSEVRRRTPMPRRPSDLSCLSWPTPHTHLRLSCRRRS